MARDDMLALLLEQLLDGLAEVRAAAREALGAAQEARAVLAPLPARLDALEARLVALERGAGPTPEPVPSSLRLVALRALPAAMLVAGACLGLGGGVALVVVAWSRPDLLPSLLGASHAVPAP